MDLNDVGSVPRPEKLAPPSRLETCSKPRIYLDNAATSWPKPEAVYQAVDRTQREVGAAAGRGAYAHAQQAQRIVANARAACARLLGIADPQQLAFTSNGTEALNLAIHGLLRPGDHVVTTVCEHNSVLRPLTMQARLQEIETSYVGCDGSGYVDPDDVLSAMK
ncbi:MAG: aminotransferase class V-fold PLP-dependent enzyme, partial [Planctomycetes bacterium]|nr:aminotransferase class V-fold PLP-dependent enzyme [Planctomycetota bacterium]